MDTALPQKFPFILDKNLAKANCTENRVCTSCDTVVLDKSIRCAGPNILTKHLFNSKVILIFFLLETCNILKSDDYITFRIVILHINVNNPFFTILLFIYEERIFLQCGTLFCNRKNPLVLSKQKDSSKQKQVIYSYEEVRIYTSLLHINIRNPLLLVLFNLKQIDLRLANNQTQKIEMFYNIFYMFYTVFFLYVL